MITFTRAQVFLLAVLLAALLAATSGVPAIAAAGMAGVLLWVPVAARQPVHLRARATRPAPRRRAHLAVA